MPGEDDLSMARDCGMRLGAKFGNCLAEIHSLNRRRKPVPGMLAKAIMRFHLLCPQKK
jgi:hypothetical protein